MLERDIYELCSCSGRDKNILEGRSKVLGHDKGGIEAHSSTSKSKAGKYSGMLIGDI